MLSHSPSLVDHTIALLACSLRIRMPPKDFDPAVVVGSRPRPRSANPGGMIFGTGKRKKIERRPQTSVEVMAGSGVCVCICVIRLKFQYCNLFSRQLCPR